MAKWQNFSIWRGRLPHWRADHVRYYLTFRHKRDLNESEMNILLQRLMRAQRRKLDFHILVVRPEATEMIFTVEMDSDGVAYELSDVIEKAKRKAGQMMIKKSGERWPPLYGESFDRIIRDEEEYESTWQSILSSPVDAELVEDPSDWFYLFVPDAPDIPHPLQSC